MTFGKSRVQFRNFLWGYFRFEKFDTYYYLNGRELAMYTAEYADTHIKEIENELQSTLEEKVQFIIFNNLTDLKQSNIGLEQEEESYNTGGVTKIIGGKVMIYFDGNYNHFERQIRAGIATVILNEMIYGSGIGAQIKNNAIFTMPEWYMNGLISYISEKWNPEMDNVVKDAILKRKYEKFNHLQGIEATYAGHSLWNYISMKYGESSIPNIVYIARLNRNVEKGFLYVLGISFKDLVTNWLNFYKGVYQGEDSSRTDPIGNKIIKKLKTEKVYHQLKISPDGKYAAYCVHYLGIYKVYLFDFETKKVRKIYRGGYRISDKPDFSFPILAWHPTGEILGIITEKKGEDYLYFYSIKEKTLDLQILHDFQKILDFSYSDDGSKLVLSAVQKGQSDIYVYNIVAGSYEQITKDIYDDLNPRFINHSSEIIFSSNRDNDTIRFDPVVSPKDLHPDHDIFIYNYAGMKPVLRRITSTPMVDEIQPMAYDDNFLCYLSDQNGIYNRYLARFDSAITYIDTAMHYRYFTTSFPITNYSRNILEQDISTQAAMIGDVSYLNNRNILISSDRIEPKFLKPVPLQNTFYENFKMGLYGAKVTSAGKDTTAKKQEVLSPVVKKHFTTVRTNEPSNAGNTGAFPAPAGEKVKDTIHRLGLDTSLNKHGRTFSQIPLKDTTNKYRTSRPLNYNVEYAINKMVTQIDFNYLNTAYQPFTGAQNPIFINPGLNALFMVGVTDLMEDYRITGGVRLNFDLINNEYLLSYANFKYRLHHEITFHRQSIEESDNYTIRHRINELYYIATYPFTPVFNIKGTATLRYDRGVYSFYGSNQSSNS